MASVNIIRRELASLGAAFGKHPDWAGQAAPGFTKACTGVDDLLFVELCAEYAVLDVKEPPRPIDILRMAAASRARNQANAPGCRGCRGSGWREVAVHVLVAHPGRPIEEDCEVRACRCTCERGKAHAGPAYDAWAETQRVRTQVVRVVIDPSFPDRMPAGWVPAYQPQGRPKGPHTPWTQVRLATPGQVAQLGRDLRGESDDYQRQRGQVLREAALRADVMDEQEVPF